MNEPSLILKRLTLVPGIGAIAAFIFFFSVIFLYFLAPIAVIGFILVMIGEWWRAFPKRSWWKYLCWAWIVLITPTFGIMPILIASRLHFYLPVGNTLGIFAGITYSYIYDFFLPTPELFVWDHPFPPVTHMQLYGWGVATFLLTILPIHSLIRLHRAKAA